MTAVDLLTLPALPPGVRTLSNEEVTRLMASDPTVTSVPTTPTCITCRGAGEFRWWVPPRSEARIGTYECPCVSQWLLYRFLLNAGLGKAYQQMGWDDVETADERGVARVRTYIENAEGYVANGVGMIFHGGVGTGKTMLATLLLKHLLGEGYDGYFTTLSTMLDMFTSGFHDEVAKKHYYRRIRNSEFLVIDDPGKEIRQRVFKAPKDGEDVALTRSTALAESTLGEVVRHRVASAKPTVITTNLTIEQLRRDYGEHLVDLLTERSTATKFRNASFREASRLRLDQEIQMGLQRPLVLQ